MDDFLQRRIAFYNRWFIDRRMETRIQEDELHQDASKDDAIYKVVVNQEAQYSIWPVDRENPYGWQDAGQSGASADCLAYIKEVWTDMRPLSLRQKK